MKVYVVMEEVTIAGQDCERVMGVFLLMKKLARLRMNTSSMLMILVGLINIIGLNAR